MLLDLLGNNIVVQIFNVCSTTNQKNSKGFATIKRAFKIFAAMCLTSKYIYKQTVDFYVFRG